MHRRQTRALAGVVESSQLVVPQREVPVAPCAIGTGTLAHFRERFGLVLELGLLHQAQRPQGTTGCTEGDAEALSKRTQRLALSYRPRRGHAFERAGGDEMRVQRVGRGRGQVERPPLLPYIPRNERVGRLHLWHDTLGFLAPLPA